MAPLSQLGQPEVLSGMQEKRDVFIAFKWKEGGNNGRWLEAIKPVHLKHLSSEPAIYMFPEGKGIHPCMTEACSVI